MYGLKLISETIPKVTDKVFARKYIMLGRLLTQWEDIVGSALADKTQPVKIRYFKRKNSNKKATASLDIACTSAESTVLHYQKDLILERINRIFGEDWITDIKFVPEVSNRTINIRKQRKFEKKLSTDDQKALEDMLEDIKDPDLQEKLENLGAAILKDRD